MSRKYTAEDRAEIARRVKLRIDNTNKQIAADFKCSRSFVDVIAKQVTREMESNLLSYENSATCQDARP